MKNNTLHKNVVSLIGNVYGKLTVVAYAGRSKWLCRCTCGRELLKQTTKLHGECRLSCACARIEGDLTGKIFGQLTVTGIAPIDSGHNVRYHAVCKCGNVIMPRGCRLLSGETTSCGDCVRRISIKYSPQTGLFYADSKPILPGSNGYVRVWHDNYGHMAGRFAWKLVHGDIPAGYEIDHINRKPADNRIANLRLVTSSENKHNQVSRKGSTSKYRGVCWDRSRSKWMARFTLLGKVTLLGRFDTEVAAAIAYNNYVKFIGHPTALLNTLPDE